MSRPENMPDLNSAAQQLVNHYRNTGNSTLQLSLMIGMAKLHPGNYAYAVHTRPMAEFVIRELARALPEATHTHHQMEFALPNGSKIRVFPYKDAFDVKGTPLRGFGDWEIIKDHAAH